jgi:hypothetical protein
MSTASKTPRDFVIGVIEEYRYQKALADKAKPPRVVDLVCLVNGREIHVKKYGYAAQASSIVIVGRTSEGNHCVLHAPADQVAFLFIVTEPKEPEAKSHEIGFHTIVNNAGDME